MDNFYLSNRKIASLNAESSKKNQVKSAESWDDSNIGVIKIHGELVSSEDSFLSFFFDSISYQSIFNQLALYEKDNKIKNILLDINSNGGDAAGVSELSEYINNYPKPVYAYIGGVAASAAYWIAASARLIFAHKTAFVGSVGTAIYFHNSDGGKYLVSDQSPLKIPDPSTDEGVLQIKNHLNYLSKHFISDVSRYRKKDEKYIQENFGGGDIVNAEQALNVGMIDHLGSFKSTMDFIKLKLKKNEGKKMRFKNELVLVDSGNLPAETPAEEVTVDTITKNFPEIADKLKKLGRDEAETETAEVAEIADTADLDDAEERDAVSAAFSFKISAKDLSKKLLTIKKTKQTKAKNILDQRMGDQMPESFFNGSHTGDKIENKNLTADFLQKIKKNRGAK